MQPPLRWSPTLDVRRVESTVEPLWLVWHQSFVPPGLRRVRLDETLQQTSAFGSFSSEASFQRNLWIPSSAADPKPYYRRPPSHGLLCRRPPKHCRRHRPQALPSPMTLSHAAAVANPKPCCCRRRPQASWWLVSSPGANLVRLLLKIWFVSWCKLHSKIADTSVEHLRWWVSQWKNQFYCGRF
jgi:hypothetical protein